MKHSERHLGLQQHSVGELYPFSVVGVGNSLVARNLTTGENCGPYYNYSGNGPLDLPSETFETCHNRAENDCRQAKLKADSLASLQVQSREPIHVVEFPLVECCFLLPRHGCNAVTESAIAESFGGFTRHDAIGSWKTDGGELIADKLYRYTVAISENRVSELLEFAISEGNAIGETCIYFACNGKANIFYC